MIFRYPGGKSRLLPAIAGVLETCFADGDDFHDVFVGGGSILVWAARSRPKSRLHANDLDPWIYSFWRILIGKQGDFDDLVNRLGTRPTVRLFQELRATPGISHVDKAYRAIFFNRTTFSGMAGSGPIGGYEQESKWTIDCRYNARRLQSELVELRELLRGRLSVSCKDGADYADGLRECMYLDPPYYGQGSALYETRMSPWDHMRLAEALKKSGRWLLSYDDRPEVRRLYHWAGVAEIPARYSIRGRKYTWKTDSEILITPEPIVAPWQPELF